VIMNYQTVVQSPTEFPAITICNINPFNTANQNTSEYMRNVLDRHNFSKHDIRKTNIDSFFFVNRASNVIKATILNDKNLSKADLMNLGFSLRVMLISCYFNGIKCNESDFSWFWSFEYGNCYTFNGMNSLTPKYTSKSGFQNGLLIELYVGMPGLHDNYLIKTGAHVIVHNRTHKPLTKYEGVDVKVSTASSIAIKRTIYSKKEPPYSDCRKNVDHAELEDTDVFKSTLKANRYSQKLCYEICFQKLFVSRICNCVDPSVPYFYDDNIEIKNRSKYYCSTVEDFECIKDIRNEFDTNKTFSSICNDHCPTECFSIHYSTSISEADYPTDFYAEILENEPTFLSKFNVNIQQVISNQNAFSTGGNGRWQNIILAHSNNLINESLYVDPSLTNYTSDEMQRNSALYEQKKGELENLNVLQMLDTEKKKNIISGSTLMLGLYYDELRYTVIEEKEAINFDTLVGIIGK
jgi:hypothetical protein